jgi:hypothetical protein
MTDRLRYALEAALVTISKHLTACPVYDSRDLTAQELVREALENEALRPLIKDAIQELGPPSGKPWRESLQEMAGPAARVDPREAYDRDDVLEALRIHLHTYAETNDARPIRDWIMALLAERPAGGEEARSDGA